ASTIARRCSCPASGASPIPTGARRDGCRRRPDGEGGSAGHEEAEAPEVPDVVRSAFSGVTLANPFTIACTSVCGLATVDWQSLPKTRDGVASSRWVREPLPENSPSPDRGSSNQGDSHETQSMCRATRAGRPATTRVKRKVQKRAAASTSWNLG